MTRLRADLLLVLVAVIWGTAFVAQKQAFAFVGPFTFVAARFFLSALVVLPLALNEAKHCTTHIPYKSGRFLLLALAFAAGVISQQIGVGSTSVTNAGFITGLYVVFVPLIASLVFRERLAKLIWPCAILSLLGAALLSFGTGAGFTAPSLEGDAWVLVGAVAFALQVALISRILKTHPAPFRLSVFQYLSVALLALMGALLSETITYESLQAAFWPIVYAGLVSGGIAYTLQAVAQRYTPSSEAAIIMSGEALFAALASFWFLGDSLTVWGGVGCALIMGAIVLVEAGPLLRRK